MEADRYSHLPIPTYEEATSSPRPGSSIAPRGPQEISDDAERQRFLGQRLSGHHPPTAMSPRSSTDSDMGLPEMIAGDGGDARRQIEELDYLDPSQHTSLDRPRVRSNLSKHLANLSATFSSLRLPGFRTLYASVPVNEEDGPLGLPSRESRSSRRRCAWWPSALTVPKQYRPTAPTIARLCGLAVMAGSVYALFVLNIIPNTRARMGARFDPEAVRTFVQDAASAAGPASYLRYITSYDHVAGTEGDLYLARWMEEEWGNSVSFDELAVLEYFVYLNYPTRNGRKVQITLPEEKKWTAALEEDTIDRDRKQTLAWHGYSKSGEALGPLIYANGGSRDDFAWLQSHGVTTNGTIALVRYYGTQGDRALKVKAAEDVGCVGVLIYSDPADDGAGKGAVWPAGPWRPEDSLQRGTVGLTSWVAGDPLTPGWASKEDAKRIDPERSAGLVQIPSLPLAWRDAKVLIESLQGHGVEVPSDWVGGTSGGSWFSGTGARDVQAEALPEVHLENHNDENEKQPIWNVHALIQGSEQAAKKVMVGNHRDAWCFGSVDPGSGSAVLMDVISIFGALRAMGWRPLRTIEFVSWDAEEYNLVGSTEYVEDKMQYLREHGVAYINVDVGVSGNDFRADGAPSWKKPLMNVLERVVDPSTNETLQHEWEKRKAELGGLGAGSDYVAFQDMAGTSSIDFGFEGPENGYPYHSCYETFDWMERFGDPDFSYHRTLAQVWALLILEMSDRPLIPLDLSDYVAAIETYIDQLQHDAEATHARRTGTRVATAAQLKRATDGFDLQPLRAAAAQTAAATLRFHRFEELWRANVYGAHGLESMRWALQRLDYNERVSRFDTHLLDLPGHGGAAPHGVPGREQYKHIVFGPQTWNGYDAAFFPAVRDAIDAGDWQVAQAQVVKAAHILRHAGEKLVDGLQW